MSYMGQIYEQSARGIREHRVYVPSDIVSDVTDLLNQHTVYRFREPRLPYEIMTERVQSMLRTFRPPADVSALSVAG